MVERPLSWKQSVRQWPKSVFTSSTTSWFTVKYSNLGLCKQPFFILQLRTHAFEVKPEIIQLAKLCCLASNHLKRVLTSPNTAFCWASPPPGIQITACMYLFRTTNPFQFYREPTKRYTIAVRCCRSGVNGQGREKRLPSPCTFVFPWSHCLWLFCWLWWALWGVVDGGDYGAKANHHVWKDFSVRSISAF